MGLPYVYMRVRKFGRFNLAVVEVDSQTAKFSGYTVYIWAGGGGAA